MQILLIRHGESEDDFLDEDYTGSTDLPLTSRGVEQVERMAQRVCAELPPDLIWSSTLIRARQAADLLSKTTGCSVTYIDDLKEKQEDESKTDFRMRGEKILSSIRELGKNSIRVAVVSHGGMITQIIEGFLELPLVNTVWFHSDNTGIHLLEYTRNGQLIRFTNCTAHLKNNEQLSE
ncbi:histidine phosphatase family protein [Fictibacillus sp. KU28468]|uniref:histidine phosphatase family protein n=1 Tax=Fictibacillus sp. KU28468 TaxID=2991053 RepID=UPI00223DC352|nr:histidine phosphatase family protein [Fictibacillus sp. KU28468]UZJ77783.1 histidine phosphatase family protein [Fictibacillus sp. KU28468]